MASSSAGNKSKSKQFFELQGTPILIHTLRKFAANRQVSEIVVALRKNETAGFLKQAEQERVRQAACAWSRVASIGRIR